MKPFKSTLQLSLLALLGICLTGLGMTSREMKQKRTQMIQSKHGIAAARSSHELANAHDRALALAIELGTPNVAEQIKSDATARALQLLEQNLPQALADLNSTYNQTIFGNIPFKQLVPAHFKTNASDIEATAQQLEAIIAPIAQAARVLYPDLAALNKASIAQIQAETNRVNALPPGRGQNIARTRLQQLIDKTPESAKIAAALTALKQAGNHNQFKNLLADIQTRINQVLLQRVPGQTRRERAMIETIVAPLQNQAFAIEKLEALNSL